jgi:glycosyltransferase involved in cell wall biosynthesis
MNSLENPENNGQETQIGVNIAGYFSASSGLGEAGRATVRAVRAAGIPYVLNNCAFNPEYHNVDQSLSEFTDEMPYPVNLVQINPDKVFNFLETFGRESLKGRYNIGIWLWETLQFPPEWYFAFNIFDEVWTPSNFCVESMAAVSKIPVVNIPHSIDLPVPTVGKAHFNLPEDKFIFMFIFDFSSYQRKNPGAVVESFLQAFGRDNCDVLLVLKSSNAEFEPNREKELRALAQNAANIKFIDKVLSREDLNALIYHTDCYVSLHRAEGFGLTLAEAMFYGKPVIGTDFSSTTDFMNVGNSFPVRYRLETLIEDVGLYRAGDQWADADAAHATQLMRLVFENQEEAKKVGERAAADIRRMLSPQAVGQKIKKRLQRISDFNSSLVKQTTEQTIENQVSQMRQELEFVEGENHQLREKIRLMENSSFWKIRNQWFKLKRGLGLTRKY